MVERVCWQFTLEVPRSLRNGTGEKIQDRLDLLKGVELLSITANPADWPESLRLHLVMHHLAIASFYNAGNCRHLANANKIHLIRQINQELGLSTPELTTPLNYLGGDD